jgi:hypothetical protein
VEANACTVSGSTFAERLWMITDETMPKGTTSQWWRPDRRRPLAVGLAVLGMALAGCSTDMFGSHSTTGSTTATTGSTSPFSGVGYFFTGKPQNTAADAPPPSDSDIDCPTVEIRQGASTYSNNAGDESALTLRMQASFGQTARECHINAGMLSIKVGIQGRIILGPAGAPGDFTVPLRYALVQEGLQPKTIWTQFYAVPVSVPPGSSNVPWTHIQEDMVVPLPKPSELAAYVVYVGFDPAGLSASTPKKPKSKSKAKTSSAAGGQLSTR